MNKLTILAAATVLAGASSAFALEPIQGSITFDGRAAQLQKSPVGSTVFHNFTSNGNGVREVYRVNADQTLDLVSRSVSAK
ncbi:hypothetical protein M8R20_14340 [Pseudomonas sp. R2.Fl]|nr:hypothetical protein [Pseudomonas sp. R2.Fl]